MENVFGNTALALTGAVAIQATAGGATIDTPMGPMQAGLLGGLGGIFLATKMTKKKRKRQVFFASLGAACSQAGVQTYKMEIDVFGLYSDNAAAPTEAAA